jgi:hypothetical protein
MLQNTQKREMAFAELLCVYSYTYIPKYFTLGGRAPGGDECILWLKNNEDLRKKF